MANAGDKPDPELKPEKLNPNLEEDAEEEDDDIEEENDDLEEDSEAAPPKLRRDRETQSRVEKSKLDNLFRRLQNGSVPLRVHDVIVKGNTKTKEYLIEAELEDIRNATSMQEIIQAASVVNYKLRGLECFDSVNITLDAGPPELPGTANVIIEVVETKNPLSGQIGTYTKGEAKSSSVEGSLKYKNIFGYGDLWDSSLAYGFDRSAEVSAGVYFPRFKGLVSPLTARVYLLSQDWLKFSSYKERSLGLSLGLFSTKHHDLAYNLAWRTLTDPSQMSSSSVRRQLGHDFLSSLRYTFKFDKRNSHLRPTRGYAFVSTTQIGGLAPDSRCLRFLRQEFDLRFAVPFGFYRTALNFGISSGVLLPFGKEFLSMSSSLPERFFLGGNLSPICSLGGPLALWGFKTRGLGPAEPRRQVRGNSNDENGDASERDFLGGDLAVSAFADLSFDLPLRWLREKGIHGHLFACAGNVAKLTENEYRNFSFPKFLESFRSSVGAGIVFPTNLFRLEVNYCYILKKFSHDHGKSGVQISLSAPL
ncbi:sorting and assembly machinery component 50-like [Melia azedarach]|uniref:Sorting and assembly machinery component 50-like n=2 Tax=Melia azedarach TaxID=155640 RepID=A0ACC1YAH8_MELAZ|nr:sorting and assembly machinery component 50-like [Melia azedarach]KAJ4720110.1 sorting and assembly machinery component 50-like [Melia azedarach]